MRSVRVSEPSVDLRRGTDLVVVSYLVVVAVLVLAFRDRVPGWREIVLLHSAGAVAILSLPRIPTERWTPTRVFRDWYPAVVVPVFYKEVELLARAFGDWSLTIAIQRLEVALFGGHPSVYLSEVLNWLALSEAVHLCYLSYPLLVPIVGGLWYVAGRTEAFRELVFLCCATFLSAFAFYVLWPVDSPYYLFEPLAKPLSDGLVYGWVHTVSDAGGAQGGAFPSSHVSVSTVIVALAARHQPTLLRWLVPVYVGLVFATVYGRFHYALDVVGGWLLAAVLGLYAAWCRLRRSPGP